MVRYPPANAGDARDTGLIPGSGRSPRVENGNLLQYFSSILPENSMSEEPSGLQSHMTEQSTAAATFKQEQSKIRISRTKNLIFE